MYLAINSKLRGCDVVAVRVDDVSPSGYSMDRATIRQKKTGRPVRFELTDQSRHAIDDYLRLTGRKAGQFLFAGRGNSDRGLTMRQHARLVLEWVASIGFDPAKFGTHSLRRTKAVLIYLSTRGHLAVAHRIATRRNAIKHAHYAIALHNDRKSKANVAVMITAPCWEVTKASEQRRCHVGTRPRSKSEAPLAANAPSIIRPIVRCSPTYLWLKYPNAAVSTKGSLLRGTAKP